MRIYSERDRHLCVCIILAKLIAVLSATECKRKGEFCKKCFKYIYTCTKYIICTSWSCIFNSLLVNNFIHLLIKVFFAIFCTLHLYIRRERSSPVLASAGNFYRCGRDKHCSNQHPNQTTTTATMRLYAGCLHCLPP